MESRPPLTKEDRLWLRLWLTLATWGWLLLHAAANGDIPAMLWTGGLP